MLYDVELTISRVRADPAGAVRPSTDALNPNIRTLSAPGFRDAIRTLLGASREPWNTSADSSQTCRDSMRPSWAETSQSSLRPDQHVRLGEQGRSRSVGQCPSACAPADDDRRSNMKLD